MKRSSLVPESDASLICGFYKHFYGISFTTIFYLVELQLVEKGLVLQQLVNVES